MKISIKIVLFFYSIVVLFPTNSSAQDTGVQSVQDIDSVMPLRKRVELMSHWRQQKIATVLPAVMNEQDIEMWIVRRSEGQLFYSLLPLNDIGVPVTEQTPVTVPSIILYYKKSESEEVEYSEVRDMIHLNELVSEWNPKQIGIFTENIEEYRAALGKKYGSKLVSSYFLGVRWVESQLNQQLSAYRHSVGVTHDVIGQALSNRVITPDVTTSEDVKWWLIHTLLDHGISLNNPPSITHYRSQLEIPNYDDPAKLFGSEMQEDGLEIIIRRGDIIRFDIEPLYLGFGADVHQAGYVLKEGETDAPEGLKQAMKLCNRVHDIMIAEITAGKSGDEMYGAAQSNAEKEGINTRVIMHPVLYYNMPLYHGFPFLARTLSGAGMSINSDGGRGENWNGRHILYPNTVYAMEPYTMVTIPEWGNQIIELGLGEVVAFTDDGFQYVNGRQTEWYLIK